LGIVVAAAFIVVETVAMLLLKQLDPQEAFETLYLLGVVVVSAVWAVGLATTTSVASALALAYFRNWPDRHFAPLNLENGIFIVVFLAVALSTNFVAGPARACAVEADQRRREANALATQQAALPRVATLVARGVNTPTGTAHHSRPLRGLCYSRGIRRRRFCTPPISIVTAPLTRTWRTW